MTSIGLFGIFSSFITLILSIIAVLVLIYSFSNVIKTDYWSEGCPEGYEQSCKQNAAVYRFSFALVVLFFSQGIGTLFSNKYFDSLWIFKFMCYLGLLVGFFFVPAHIFDDNGFAWFARIASGIFLIYQQIIILDCAYSWNEKWVTYSGGTENFSWWLAGLLIISCILFVISFGAIGIMYWQFYKCVENLIIISLTLSLSIIVTVIQIFLVDTGSLLTSALVTSYATFVCYSSVSLNPNIICNPTIANSYQTLAKV
jgi:hypothetical protein